MQPGNGEEQKFCLRASMLEGFNAFFGRLGRLVRHPTHCSRDEQQQQQQPDFSTGNIDPIAEEGQDADPSDGSREDLEGGLSHSSSSSVRGMAHVGMGL